MLDPEKYEDSRDFLIGYWLLESSEFIKYNDYKDYCTLCDKNWSTGAIFDDKGVMFTMIPKIIKHFKEEHEEEYAAAILFGLDEQKESMRDALDSAFNFFWKTKRM